MSDIFQTLRREECRLGANEPDPLGPFKSKLYFNDWRSTVRFLTYTLLFSTDVCITPKAGAKWLLSKPGGKIGAVAESYLNEFCSLADEIAGEKFCELATRDRFMPLRLMGRVIRIASFSAQRRDLSVRERTLFGAAHARFVDDDRALRAALVQFDGLGVITFCDQIGAENHITQIVRSRGLKTVTLQHGQYRLSEGAGTSPDIEAMYNFVSDKMLCWGEATIQEFEKIGVARNRFVPIGVLQPTSEYDKNRRAKRTDRPNQNAFGLALSGDNNLHNNVELIEFAKKIQVETGMACVLRMHPRSNAALYPSLSELVYTKEDRKANFFAAIDVVVMSSTGFFLECYHRRCPFVFLESRFLPDPFRLTGAVVRSVEELLEQIQNTDWNRMKLDLMFYFNDTARRNQRIMKVLDGQV